MTPHCPACATADELARHRDAACPEWSVRRATLNFAVVIARRNCPAYEPVTGGDAA